ncbi:MAG: hypothetical protein QJR07_00420 [Acetobacteraceae bacterium]|nr:hypothetical protein [Acetobacteraceae bacterium]MDI3305537.1 hypothetical protein [Acetobacteraceae bacterium]
MTAWRLSRMGLGLGGLLFLSLPGCTPPGPPPLSVSLPPDAVQGAGDPTRAAIINTAYVFGNPGSIAGQPAEAARAVANYEYLAVELRFGPRWAGFSPLVATEFAQGLQEVRNAVGIAPSAPPQPVIDALYAASRALRAGDTASAERILSPPLFPAGGAATLQRLAALPLLPHANNATALALGEMNRQDQERERPGGISPGRGRR